MADPTTAVRTRTRTAEVRMTMTMLAVMSKDDLELGKEDEGRRLWKKVRVGRLGLGCQGERGLEMRIERVSWGSLYT